MQQQGPFIPFEKPIPAPITDVTEAPLRSVCFNADWTPAVVGALKVLTRAETWSGTDDDVKRVSRSAHELLASDQNGCASGGGTPCPNWYATHIEADCLSENLQFTQAISTCDGCEGNERCYLFTTQVHLVNQLARGGMSFFALSDDTPVGGHICHMFATQTDDTFPQVYNLSYYDCQNVFHVEQFAGSYFFKFDFVAKGFCITAFGAFACVFTIDGDFICGVS